MPFTQRIFYFSPFSSAYNWTFNIFCRRTVFPYKHNFSIPLSLSWTNRLFLDTVPPFCAAIGCSIRITFNFWREFDIRREYKKKEQSVYVCVCVSYCIHSQYRNWCVDAKYSTLGQNRKIEPLNHYISWSLDHNFISLIRSPTRRSKGYQHLTSATSC